MSKVYVGDTGTEIVLNAGVALAGASVLEIKVLKPDGAVVTWTAVQDGEQSVKYVTDGDDLDIPGTYQMQARVATPVGGPWLGETTRLRVYDVFR